MININFAMGGGEAEKKDKDEKANVVASVWGGGGGEFISFLAALAVLHWTT